MSINKLNINLIYDNSIKKESDNDLIYNDNLNCNKNDNNLIGNNLNDDNLNDDNSVINNLIDNNSIDNNLNGNNSINNNLIGNNSNDKCLIDNNDKSIIKESNDNNSIYDNLIYNSINLNSDKLSFNELNDNSLKDFNYNKSNVSNCKLLKISNDQLSEDPIDKLIDELSNNKLIDESNDNKLVNESIDNKLINLSNDNELINESIDNKLINESIDNKLLNEQNNKFINSDHIKRKSSEKLNVEIKLELLNSNRIYELNDTINGILKLKINKNLNSKLIRIKLKCVGEVQWQLPNCDLNSNLDNCLKEQENFLNSDYNLEKNYKPILEAGQHEIPFNFRLTDKKLPPTFRENNGFICYYLTASILNDKTDKLLIKTSPIYLNRVQIGCIRNDLKLAIAANAAKEFGNYCFKKKNKVQVHIYISRKGYTQGEIVPIEFHVINNSNHKINSNIILYQTKCFYCGQYKHIVEHHFQQLECTPVLKNKDVKEIINLKIPDNCVLSFSSSIIVVNYFIICNVNITKSIDLHLNLPILITTRKSLNSS